MYSVRRHVYIVRVSAFAHSGKVAVVSGGASGLGAAICTRLAHDGCHVVVADVDEAAGRALAAQLASASYLALDVTDESSWTSGLAVVIDEYGRLDAVINNAGIAPPSDITTDVDTWRRVMSVDLDGVFLGTKSAIDAMRSNGSRGTIVNMSSVMARVAVSTTAAYSAAKAGVLGLTRSAAMYVAQQGLPIRINAILPGTFETPLVTQSFAMLPDEYRHEELCRHPVGHFGDPAGIGAMVSFLMSDDAEFIHGAELVIDGGRTALDGSVNW